MKCFVTAFDIINSAYLEKPLVVIGATFWGKLISHHRTGNEGDSCLLVSTNKGIVFHWTSADGRCETSKFCRLLVNEKQKRPVLGLCMKFD